MAETTRSGGASPQAEFPALDGVTHRFVDLPGPRLHVAEAGRGEPVLLLHGFPQHWWEWRAVIPGLADRYRVVCPDLRGAGWSDATRTGYRRDQLLADVVALLDALGLDRVHLIAHDWGALVGFQLCLRHPDRVRRYLCLATPHPYIQWHYRLLTQLWRLWFQPVVAMPLLGPHLLGRGDQRLARYLLRSFASRPEAFSEADVEHFMARMREPSRARAGSALYRGFILPEAARILTGRYRHTRLSTPTRILCGTDDPGVRPEILTGFEDHADHLEVAYVDGAHHYIADDRPDAVLHHARTWLGGAASDGIHRLD